MPKKYRAKSPIRQQIYNEVAKQESECDRAFDINLKKLSRPVKVLGILNFKSGVGKTSITHALADAFTKAHHFRVGVVSIQLKKKLDENYMVPAFQLVNTIHEIDLCAVNLVIIDQDEVNSVETVLSLADFSIIPGQLSQKVWSETKRTAANAQQLNKPYGVFIHKRRYYKNKADEEMYYNHDEEALIKKDTFQLFKNTTSAYRLKDKFLENISKGLSPNFEREGLFFMGDQHSNAMII